MRRTTKKTLTKARSPTPLETAVNNFLSHRWSPLESPSFLITVGLQPGASLYDRQRASYSISMVDYGDKEFMLYTDGNHLYHSQKALYTERLAAKANNSTYSWGFEWSYKCSEEEGNEVRLFYSGSNGKLTRAVKVRKHLENSEALYDFDIKDPLDHGAYGLFKKGLGLSMDICKALDGLGATRTQEGGANTPSPRRLDPDDPALFNVLKTYGTFKDPVSVARLSATSRAWNKTLAQTRKQLLEGYPKDVEEALKKLQGYKGWTAETVAGYMQFGSRANRQSRNPITTIRFPNDLDEDSFMFYTTAPDYSMTIRPSIEKASEIVAKAIEKPYGARIELKWPERSTGVCLSEISVQFGPQDYTWWGKDNHILVDADFQSKEDMTIDGALNIGPFGAVSFRDEAKKNLEPIVELVQVAALRKGLEQKKVWDPTYKAVPAAAPDLHKKFTVAGFFKQARTLKTVEEIDDLVKSVVKTPGRLAEIARSDEMKGILQRNSPNRSQRYAAAVIIDKAYDDKGVREHFRREYANTPALRENPEYFGLRRSVRQGTVIFSRTPRGR